jgi:hypothetical protein
MTQSNTQSFVTPVQSAIRHTTASIPAFCIVMAITLAGKVALAGPSFTRNDGNAVQWRRVYDQMPNAWKTDRLIVVREVTEWQMDRLVSSTGGDSDPRYSDTVVDGCYQRGGPDEEAYGTISMRETLHGELAAFVFAHEYGHYVWDDLLTEAQRLSYARLWRAQKRAGHLVTDYAADSVEEGFAEAVAHYVRKPAVLRRRDPRSAAFIADLLAHSKPHHSDQD